MEKKKKILVIVIVLGVLLVVLVSLSFGNPSSLIRFLKGFLARVLRHWGVLFSGIGVVVITMMPMIIKKLREKKIEKEKLELEKKKIRLKEDEINLKKQEINFKEQEMSQARETPKIKVLDKKIRGNIIGLWVKNVGAGGELRVSVVNNERIKAKWFKSYEEMKEIGGKEKIKLARGDECYVGITRRAVIGKKSDIGLHHIKVHFSEADQIFKYSFRITKEGIEDLEFLGEEDE